ncbi:MAG: twin-arginine translocation pathway signal, partial [bacterium]
GGAAECSAKAGDRNIHAITHQIGKPEKPFQLSITAARAESGQVDSGFGFRVGIRSDIDEYRSNCFAKGGIRAGVVGHGMIVGEAEAPLDGFDPALPATILLTSQPTDQDKARLQIDVSQKGRILGSLSTVVATEQLAGNFSIVNGFEPTPRGRGSRYRFTNWQAGGEAISHQPQQAFGPILWTMYTLSDSRSAEGFVLKLSVLTGPMGADDSKTIDLEIKNASLQWEKRASADLDTDAWVVTFRLPNWDAGQKHEYRVVYRQKLRDGSQQASTWQGTVRANPAGRALRLAAMTCQNDYAFPYAPVAANLLRLDPDMLYFSGDQIYENHGGYGIIREPAEPAILNYLRKFY